MHITTEFQTFEAKRLCPLDTREALINEVWSGLRKRPRSLLPWMLYDSEGSRLFECITTPPEYYPTRTERDHISPIRSPVDLVGAFFGDAPPR